MLRRKLPWNFCAARLYLLRLLLAVAVLSLGTVPVAHAATLAVTKTQDTDDGVCNADCSLREAIDDAVAGDTVEIPAGTYTLTLGTELFIDKGLTLNGAGADSTSSKLLRNETQRTTGYCSFLVLPPAGAIRLRMLCP